MAKNKTKTTPISYEIYYKNLDGPKNGVHAPLQQNLKSLETPWQQNPCIDKKVARLVCYIGTIFTN